MLPVVLEISGKQSLQAVYPLEKGTEGRKTLSGKHI